VPHQALPLFGKSESELILQTLQHVSVRRQQMRARERKAGTYPSMSEATVLVLRSKEFHLRLKVNHGSSSAEKGSRNNL